MRNVRFFGRGVLESVHAQADLQCMVALTPKQKTVVGMPM